MQIQNRILSLLLCFILIVAAATGLWHGLKMPGGGCDWTKFVYFTFLSNFLCLLYFIAAAAYIARCIKSDGIRGDAALCPYLKGSLVIVVSITLLIYWLVLAPRINNPRYNPWALGNLLLHYITPIMVIGDWLLFDRKNVYKAYAPFLWLSVPLLYLLFILVRAHFYGTIGTTGSRYPYFFINIDKIGLKSFGINVFLLMLLFLGMGYVLWLMDKILARKNWRCFKLGKVQNSRKLQNKTKCR